MKNRRNRGVNFRELNILFLAYEMGLPPEQVAGWDEYWFNRMVEYVRAREAAKA